MQHIASHCWNKWHSFSWYNFWYLHLRAMQGRPQIKNKAECRPSFNLPSNCSDLLARDIDPEINSHLEPRNSFILRNNRYIQCDVFTRRMMLLISDIHLLTIIRYLIESNRRDIAARISFTRLSCNFSKICVHNCKWLIVACRKVLLSLSGWRSRRIS